jgi:hypothetical protein
VLRVGKGCIAYGCVRTGRPKRVTKLMLSAKRRLFV